MLVNWRVVLPKIGQAVAVLMVGLTSVFGWADAPQVVSDSCDAHLTEAPPKFRVGRHHYNEDRQSMVLNVSIAHKEVTQAKLLSLSCNLGRHYSSLKALVVWILDDYRAAKRFSRQGEGNDAATVLAFRGSYYFSRETNEQSLGWFPDPQDHTHKIEIKLGLPPSGSLR
jgi:hypothetical protein